MSRDQGRPDGPQPHAEGAHGERTHARFIEQLHESEPRPADSEPLGSEARAPRGEDREQHDEAEKPRNKD
jgi:hypothetical protein